MASMDSFDSESASELQIVERGGENRTIQTGTHSKKFPLVNSSFSNSRNLMERRDLLQLSYFNSHMNPVIPTFVQSLPWYAHLNAI